MFGRHRARYYDEEMPGRRHRNAARYDPPMSKHRAPARPDAADAATGSAAGRRLRGWTSLAAVLVIAWLAVGAFGGQRIGALSSVSSNDSASYLPKSSEAARVQAEQATFTPGDAAPMLPAIVVGTRDGGVTDADTAYLSGVINDFELAQSSDASASPVRRLAVSADGEAAQAALLLPATDATRAQVGALRTDLATPPAGLTVLVTGPAGLVADLVHAFSGIDGVLLLVAAAAVALILLLVYRGPLLVLLVLLSAVFALSAAAIVVYQLAKSGDLKLSGMSQGILFILVFGAATDYALLLVSRYRQELRDRPGAAEAMLTAWRATFAPITASAATVILGVLCLLFSDLASTRDLGPVAAIGIAAAYLASMTFLPAVLMLCRRAPFWPLVPHAGTDHPETSGLWQRVSGWVARYPRRIWAVTALVLVAFAAFTPMLKAHGTTQSEVFLTSVDSVAGEDVLGAHVPGGTGSPTVILANASSADAVLTRAKSTAGVVSATMIPAAPGTAAQLAERIQIQVTLAATPSSQQALATVQSIRDAVHAVPGADAIVGGQDALQLDTNRTSERDRTVIIPIVLVVVFLVLALLLRALVAPLVLIATVVVSYLATLGVGALVFNHVFDFPGADPSVPLFAFVFLVALGIDYNIFLMTRVREEAQQVGTSRGTVRGLALTGGVITSAGVVLAATFAALAVLPILFLAQMAFLVAFGVLLDTIVVRSILVPALTLHIGPRMWWPSRLARKPDELPLDETV
jgi:RND superfamily putative drug exporter